MLPGVNEKVAAFDVPLARQMATQQPRNIVDRILTVYLMSDYRRSALKD
jgi:hypothetical protein